MNDSGTVTSPEIISRATSIATASRAPPPIESQVVVAETTILAPASRGA